MRGVRPERADDRERSCARSRCPGCPEPNPAIAFQANDGVLKTDVVLGSGNGVGVGASLGQPMAPGTSPSITAAILPPQGLSLTAKVNVLAQLRKPRTLVLLVYSRPKPPGQLKLFGRVAAEKRPAGLSRIAWGLRVHTATAWAQAITAPSPRR